MPKITKSKKAIRKRFVSIPLKARFHLGRGSDNATVRKALCGRVK